MGMERFGEIEFPSDEQKNESIAQIVSRSVVKPRRLGSALWEIWTAAGFHGICFGVWDCMLLALLLDGLLWAAVYESARRDSQILGLLVFLASPVLYALLHLLTVWKEMMAGLYQALMVCRLSLRQMTVFRLMLFGGISVVLLGILGIWLGSGPGQEMTAIRMLSLSASALFFYAWMQILLEWKWKSRIACWAAPVLWSGFCVLLLLLAWHDIQVLEKIPTAALLVCAGVSAGMYLKLLKIYLFESYEVPA